MTFSRVPPWLRTTVRHPVFPLLPFVVFLAIVKENYPFTNYPMYSNPGPGPISYYYLADSTGTPIPVSSHCGITSPRMKRLYERKVAQLRRSRPDLRAEEVHRIVLDEVFPFLRGSANRRHRPLPDEPMRLYKGEIYHLDDGEFSEEVVMLGEELWWHSDAVADDGEDDEVVDLDNESEA